MILPDVTVLVYAFRRERGHSGGRDHRAVGARWWWRRRRHYGQWVSQRVRAQDLQEPARSTHQQGGS